MEREFRFRYYDPSIKAMLTPACVGEFGFYAEDRDFEDGKSLPFDRLMQFTGIHDRQGKEIYDRDILETVQGTRFVVEWHNDNCQWCLKDDQGLRWDLHRYMTPNLWVEGNIYQNPELINKATS